LEQTKAALTLAVERIKWYYDQKVQSVPFKVGNKVLLNLKDYQTMERALQPWYEGPFKIIEKLSLVTFQLRMCYESPKRRKVSQAFEYLIQNLKMYNRVEDINSVGTRVM